MGVAQYVHTSSKSTAHSRPKSTAGMSKEMLAQVCSIPCKRLRRERRLLDGGRIGVWHMAGVRRAGAELDLGGLTAR